MSICIDSNCDVTVLSEENFVIFLLDLKSIKLSDFPKCDLIIGADTFEILFEKCSKNHYETKLKIEKNLIEYLTKKGIEITKLRVKSYLNMNFGDVKMADHWIKENLYDNLVIETMNILTTEKEKIEREINNEIYNKKKKDQMMEKEIFLKKSERIIIFYLKNDTRNTKLIIFMNIFSFLFDPNDLNINFRIPDAFDEMYKMLIDLDFDGNELLFFLFDLMSGINDSYFLSQNIIEIILQQILSDITIKNENSPVLKALCCLLPFLEIFLIQKNYNMFLNIVQSPEITQKMTKDSVTFLKYKIKYLQEKMKIDINCFPKRIQKIALNFDADETAVSVIEFCATNSFENMNPLLFTKFVFVQKNLCKFLTKKSTLFLIIQTLYKIVSHLQYNGNGNLYSSLIESCFNQYYLLNDDPEFELNDIRMRIYIFMLTEENAEFICFLKSNDIKTIKNLIIEFDAYLSCEKLKRRFITISAIIYAFPVFEKCYIGLEKLDAIKYFEQNCSFLSWNGILNVIQFFMDECSSKIFNEMTDFIISELLKTISTDVNAILLDFLIFFKNINLIKDFPLISHFIKSNVNKSYLTINLLNGRNDFTINVPKFILKTKEICDNYIKYGNISKNEALILSKGCELILHLDLNIYFLPLRCILYIHESFYKNFTPRVKDFVSKKNNINSELVELFSSPTNKFKPEITAQELIYYFNNFPISIYYDRNLKNLIFNRQIEEYKRISEKNILDRTNLLLNIIYQIYLCNIVCGKNEKFISYLKESIDAFEQYLSSKSNFIFGSLCGKIGYLLLISICAVDGEESMENNIKMFKKEYGEEFLILIKSTLEKNFHKIDENTTNLVFQAEIALKKALVTIK